MTTSTVTFLQPDAPRVGGITPFLKIAAQADLKRLKLAPHFVMEIHIHLACAYPHEAWVEHIEWLEPAFNERLQIGAGHMRLPTTPGLGFSFPTRHRPGVLPPHNSEPACLHHRPAIARKDR